MRTRTRRWSRSATRLAETCAAAPATSKSSRPCSSPRNARVRRRRHDAARAAIVTSFRYIGTKRRAKEHPRFVSGRGRYVADVALPGVKHVALVASPHASARIVSIDAKAALEMPGVHCVLTGEEFCAATDSLAIGVDAPNVTRWALARGVVRYAGEWVAAVVADTRAQ